ncbi:hypothetical protein [Microbacterium halophytorum]|uniref:hypothetical protein n=1 Tax=Microbacterium halophytorum TaxID=2067568 RepID=UPI000CFC58C5|nr:hypothetical protein [Microbacterium halophytorum]
MSAPLIRIDRLSPVELSAARLDGDVFELGGGFMPADAPECSSLRAATLASAYGSGLVAVGLSAAWVHGAVPGEPLPHLAQPLPGVRARGRRHIIGLRVRDRPIEQGEAVRVGGLWVLTPERTLGDIALALAAAETPSRGRRLASRADRGDLAAAYAALSSDAARVAAAIRWLEDRTMSNKRGALRALRQVRPT